MRTALTLARRLALAAVALVPLLAVTPAAQANIVSVTTSPSSGQVAIPNGSTVTVNWLVKRANTIRVAQQTIVSPSGTIAIGGTTVATIATRFSRLNTTPTGQTTTETFTETLVVPRNVALQIARIPGLAVTYNRTFDDGSGFTASGSLTLIPSGASGAELGIRRLELFFADRSRVKILPNGADLFALAEISATGSGTAELEWQVAEPSSTRGALVYRRLQIVRRSFSGQTRQTLRSPALPTRIDGLYIVRLVVTDPQLQFDTPELKYFVVPRQGAAAAPAGQLVNLLGPVENASLTPDTEFAWQSVPGAAVYQLEIYPPRPDSPVGPARPDAINSPLLVDPDELAQHPVAGIALPASDTSVSLKAHSLQRLAAGGAFLWRVKAIAGNGAVIGASPLRRITVPR